MGGMPVEFTIASPLIGLAWLRPLSEEGARPAFKLFCSHCTKTAGIVDVLFTTRFFGVTSNYCSTVLLFTQTSKLIHLTLHEVLLTCVILLVPYLHVSLAMPITSFYFVRVGALLMFLKLLATSMKLQYVFVNKHFFTNLIDFILA